MEGEFNELHDVTFNSSHKVIEYVSALINNSVSITIDPRLDFDKPSIFCSNHFTRIETFLLPNFIYKKLGIKVRSLAHETLFNTFFGEYLTNAGVLPTNHPNRDNIICADLIKAKVSWIIYPEGNMMKNKRVTLEDDCFMLHIEDLKRPMHTGSSVIAIESELTRMLLYEHQDDLFSDTAAQHKIKQYNIENIQDISSKPLQIVPVTITYFPIRPGENKILHLADSLLSIESNNFFEELEIEGNLLLDANMHIHLGEPIDMHKYIHSKKKQLSNTLQNTSFEIIIDALRHDLTSLVMERVYANVTLTFDHIFALILDTYIEKTFRVSHLKTIMYICVDTLEKHSVYNLHKMLGLEFYKLLIDEPFEIFENVFSLAINQKIIAQNTDGSFTVNQDTFHNQHQFHTIRLKNTLRVLLNEIELLVDLRAIISSIANMDYRIVSKNAFNIIIQKDVEQFEQSYKKHFSLLSSKSKDVGAPYVLYNEKYTNGVVLSHGYKSSPGEVKELANYLHQHRYNVYAIRMEGHGTNPEDLKDKIYQQWLDGFNRGFGALRQVSKKLYLCGFSAGGLLAIHAATSKYHKIDGLICINTAIEIKDMAFNYIVPALGAVHSWLGLINANVEYVQDTTKFTDTNYNKHYISSILQLKKLIDATKNKLQYINLPTLIIQSDNDPIVSPKSAKIIFDTIASEKKELKYIQSSNHIIVRTDEKTHVFKEIKKFLAKH